MESGFFGKVLTSTMLITVLNTLGLNLDAEVRASDAEASRATMGSYGLRPGWIKKC